MLHSQMHWQVQTLDSPQVLNSYMLQIHHAAQFVASMGNAFCAKESDDSQSNLAWISSRHGLLGHEIKFDTSIWVGLLYHPFELHIFDTNLDSIAYLNLGGEKKSDIILWLKQQITTLGGHPDHFRMIDHFEIPHHPTMDGEPFVIRNMVYHQEMAKYRSNAALVLKELAEQFEHASKVRIWPHHFDIGAFIPLAFSEQNTPTKAISIGLAVADHRINEYYYYVSQWLAEGNVQYENLPPLDSGGDWICQEDYNGAVLPISALLKTTNAEAQHQLLYQFFTSAINASLKLLEVNQVI